jgi:large subunit ribosomal protein L21
MLNNCQLPTAELLTEKNIPKNLQFRKKRLPLRFCFLIITIFILIHSQAMYAIVEIQGKQFKVSEGQEIFVNRVQGEEGSQVTFDKVLLVSNNGSFQIGKPLLEGTKVSTTIVQHLKSDKVLIFKKRRRKGYQILKGHRQPISKIKIDSIG